MTYEPDNIFAQILRGDIPCHKVYEDDATLAFLDVNPRSEGHTLIIPKSPCRNLFDASDVSLVACMRTAKRLSDVLMTVLEADGIYLVQRNEAAAGQVVFHLHYHLIPCYRDKPLLDEGTVGHADHDALGRIARRLRGE